MIKYKLKIHISEIDLFNSTINMINKSINHILDIIFTFVAIICLIYLILTKEIYNIDITRIIGIILCIIMFPIIQPIIFYIKTKIKYKKYPYKDIDLIIYDDKDIENSNKIVISNEKDSASLNLNQLNDIYKFKNMILIMYDNIHGQIVPNKAFIDNNVDKNEFYDYIKSRIKK